MTVSYKISTINAGNRMIMNVFVIMKGFRRDNAKKTS
jgi:hypothetical protein